MTPTHGTVISLHRLGATVRLVDGTLAAVPASEVNANPAPFSDSLRRREPLALVLEAQGRHRAAFLSRGATERSVSIAPLPRHDSAFEEQMRRYLKSTEEWAPPDRPDPAERHFIRKKRRAAHFEARAKAT